MKKKMKKKMIMCCMSLFGMLCFGETFSDSNNVTWHYEITDGAARITNCTFNKNDSDVKIIFPDTLGGAPVTGESLNYNSCFSESSISYVKLPEYMTVVPDFAFEFCRQLQEVVFGSKVKKIGNGSFGKCTSLNIAVLPDSLREIGPSAFYDCHLSEVKIPTNCYFIGERAFKEMQSLKKIWVPASATIWGYEHNGASTDASYIVFGSQNSDWWLDSESAKRTYYIHENSPMKKEWLPQYYAKREGGLMVYRDDGTTYPFPDDWDETRPNAISFIEARTLNTVSEAADFVEITLTRRGLTEYFTDSVAIGYVTSNVTAIAGVNYEHTEDIAVFEPYGVNANYREQKIKIPIRRGGFQNGEYGKFVVDLFQLSDANLPEGAHAAKLGYNYRAWVTISESKAYVSFEKTELKVKENVANVTLTLKRDGDTEKASAIRCVAQDGTATAGDDFAPFDEVVTWEPGEKKKTVTIKLLPELMPTWEGDETFIVKLEKPEASTIPDGYVAALVGSSDNGIGWNGEANVTLQEATGKINVGTVSFAAYKESDSFKSFADPKKPAFITSKNEVSIYVAREGGDNGCVAVKATATDAKKNVIGSKEFVWENGIEGFSFFTFDLPSVAAFTEQKITVTLTVIKKNTYVTNSDNTDVKVTDDAKLGTAKSVTITVRNNETRTTLEERIAADKSAKSAVTLAGTKGMWAFDGAALKSTAIAAGKKADISFAATGPGMLTLNIQSHNLKEGDTFEAVIGKEKYDLSALSGEKQFYLPSGKQTLKITATTSKTARDDSDPTCVLFEAVASDCYAWKTFKEFELINPAEKGVYSSSPSFKSIVKNQGDVGYPVYMVGDNKSKLFKDTDLGYSTSPERLEFFKTGKTYYARVDSKYTVDGSERIATNKTVYTFTIAPAGVVATRVTGGDAHGKVVAVEPTEGNGITLYQGVKASFDLGVSGPAENLSFAIVSGKLPAGMKLDSKNAVITGIPTAVGTNTVVVQAKEGKTGGLTQALRFEVKPLGAIAGKTFQGILKIGYFEYTKGGTVPAAEIPVDVNKDRVGQLTLTVGKTGALSAKLQIAGKSYTFKGTGFDLVEYNPGSSEEVEKVLVLSHMESDVKIGNKTFKNTLDIRLPVSDDVKEVARYGSPTFTAFVNLQYGSDVYNVEYYRYESSSVAGDYRKEKDETLLSWYKQYEGYYTASLKNVNASEGDQQGYGYLTVTIDKNLNAKIAGQLSDGTAISCSSVPFLHEGGDMLLPYYFFKGKTLFAGKLRFFNFIKENYFVDKGIVIETDDDNIWINVDPNATWTQKPEGFAYSLNVEGGYYNTTWNLQRYYYDLIGGDLEISGGEITGDFVQNLMPSGMLNMLMQISDAEPLTLAFNGNNLEAAKQSLVKAEGSKTLYDLEKSVNPLGLTVNYTRATGLFKGSFNMWYDNVADGVPEAKFKQVKQKVDYAGVMVLTVEKDDKALPTSIPGRGYFKLQIPRNDAKKTKWTGSWPISIGTQD